MRIRPTTKTVGDFFSNSSEQFFVPTYQRRYAWGISQLDALFNDINLLKEGDTHLLGTIVLLVGPHSAGINALEVVDGQQRVTTLCILLKVLHNKLDKKSDSGELWQIEQYLASRSGDELEQKMLLGDLDSADFKKIMSGKSGSSLENERLGHALDFFATKIDELGPDTLKFYRKLTGQVELIRLDIDEARDAYKLFETINNRGLKLSEADIIKNFLLGHASTLGDEMLDEVKEQWRHVILSLDELGYSDIDKFFRHYLMGIIRFKVPKSRLGDEFKNYYYLNIKEAEKLSDYMSRIQLIGRRGTKRATVTSSDDYDENADTDIAKFSPETYQKEKIDISKFSKGLRDAAAIYRSLLLAEDNNPDIARKLAALKKIESLPAYTFLLSIRWDGIGDEQFLKVLDLVESFMLRRQICEYRTGELDDIFPRLCSLPIGEDLAKNVKKELAEHLPGDDEFLEKFQQFSSKTAEERVKHILSRIEDHLGGNSGEIDIRGGDEVHLEHIIPQTIIGKKAQEEGGGDWVKYLGDDKDKVKELHKKYINRIGNLTVLAKKLNIQASNNPFKSKIAEYKKSMFLLNKDLVDKYEEFRFPQVDDRSRSLAEIAVQIWKF